jgi:predicted nucleotidyltransferase
VSRNHRAAKRLRVAQEAANMLYTRQEKEYRQAKLRAVETLGFHVLPSNAEIAAELDRIAEEREGVERQERLAERRREALQMMQTLNRFSPVLVGSVWRGTARHGSDIDIIVYARSPRQPLSTLQESNYPVVKAEVQKVTKKGREEHSFHVHVKLPSGDEAEIVVRSPDEVNRTFVCEIYGDVVTGLTTKQLQKVLEENPLRRFLPA